MKFYENIQKCIPIISLPKRQVLAVNALLWQLESFFFFLPHHIACGILVPQPGIDPGPQ